MGSKGARSEGARPHVEHCAVCEPAKPKAWWKDQGLWGLALIGIALAAGRFWAPAQPVALALWGYIRKAGWAILLGLLLGGIIEHYVPKEYVSLWLTGRHRRVVLASAGLGFLASSCSHGCLALTVELYRKGASVPAVITFLLASPWASLSLTLLIISLMGWRGLLIVVMALGVAVVTGWIFQRLESQGLIRPNAHTVSVAPGFSIRADFKDRLRRRSWRAEALLADVKAVVRGAWGLAQMVLLWVALGFTLSALFGTLIPHGWWGRFLGPTAGGLLLTLGIAAAIEVCSEGTAPLAVELYRNTGALGNAFGFLVGGVVTDFTELSVLWANLGPKTVGWLLLVTLPQVFVLGLIMNWMGK